MAGTKTWADGDAITAADLNGYVRDQWITVCTAGTRPTTSQEGRHIFETDTDRLLVWDGSAWAVVREDKWSTYTPTWTASTTNPVLGNGTITGRWRYTGPKTIDFTITLTTGSTSTYGSGPWRFSLPGSLSSTASAIQSGTWFTGTGPKVGVAFTSGAAYVELAFDSNYVSATQPHTWAATQSLNVTCRGIECA